MTTKKNLNYLITLRKTSATCVPSTFETKWTLSGPSLPYGFKASVTIYGPRSEPPIPILTTSVIDFPV